MSNMTLREKLELAGYRLRALAAHMPTEWQKQTALSWADDAVRASGMKARQGGNEVPSRSDDSPTRSDSEGGRP
jgi:hypothetical protein